MPEKIVAPPKYNLFDREFFANPYAVVNKMREEDPIYFFEPAGWWFVMRYSDVVAILQDTARFSSNRAREIANAQVPDAPQDLLEDYVRSMAQLSFFSDPPQHTNLRKIANRGFTPTTITLMEARIQKLVDELLNDFQEQGKTDIYMDFCAPLPGLVIADFMGIPREDRHSFQTWSSEWAKLFSGTQLTVEQAKLSQKCAVELRAYLVEQINKRRNNPKEDMMSFLLAGEDAGKISSEDVAALCLEITTGGSNTTANLLGNGILAFANHPEQLQKLKDEPELWTNAVEELLRYDSPVIFMNRLIKENVKIGGQEFKKGQIVFVGLGSSNHDPRVFNEPERFNITRKNIKHLSLGKGPHQCMGAALARLETRIALQTVFKRFPNLQIVGEILWQVEEIMFHAPRSLPLTF